MAVLIRGRSVADLHVLLSRPANLSGRCMLQEARSFCHRKDKKIMQLVPVLLCKSLFLDIEMSEPVSDVVARHGFVRTSSKCGESRQCVLRLSSIRREVLENVGLSGAQQDQARFSQCSFDGGGRTAILCMSRFGILKGRIG